MFTNHVPTRKFKHYETEAQRAGEQLKANYTIEGEGEAEVEIHGLGGVFRESDSARRDFGLCET